MNESSLFGPILCRVDLSPRSARRSVADLIGIYCLSPLSSLNAQWCEVLPYLTAIRAEPSTGAARRDSS
jgi:hypothetical protein